VLHRCLLGLYQILPADSGPTLDLLAAFVPQDTKTDLTPSVGRLHWSLGPTLSAHFRWSVGASERIQIACQYLCTSKWPGL
jgi:hypothetical protein